MLVSPNYTELLTTVQMRACEAFAMQQGIAGRTLMENAGRRVVELIESHYAKRPVCVVCGTGNNGGDGFVVARLLKQNGWPVTVMLVGEDASIKADAALARDAWKSAGGVVSAFDAAKLNETKLVIDALLGIGLNREVDGAVRDAILAIQDGFAPVISIDMPSGIHADTGEVMGVAVLADLTVTFFRSKPGLHVMPGKSYAGRVGVVQMGIPEASLAQCGETLLFNGPQLWRGLMPSRDMSAHKYFAGHAVISGGPLAMTGAARLAAQAALRTGTGLVTVACDNASLPVYAGALTSIMTQPVKNAAVFGAFLKDKRITAISVGCGNDVTEETRGRLTATLSSGKPCVVDADAITILGKHKKLRKLLHDKCVLTPHDGEFERMFSLKMDRVARARLAAKECGAVIVLKGSDTIVASPTGRIAINNHAPATLATAGSGDVLAGIITGLLAQGMGAFSAACAGVWLHGDAAYLRGDGLIAEDLPGLMPRALLRAQQ